MSHYSRQVEQDLLPLTQRLITRFSVAIAETADECGRDTEDALKAALLALAITARGSRVAAALPIEAWSEANRIAAAPGSLTNLAPLLPQTVALIHRSKRT